MAITEAVKEIEESVREGCDPFDTDCYKASARSLADSIILRFTRPEVCIKDDGWMTIERYYKTLNL